jgi:hypothetical protein
MIVAIDAALRSRPPYERRSNHVGMSRACSSVRIFAAPPMSLRTSSRNTIPGRSSIEAFFRNTFDVKIVLMPA